MKTLPRDQGWSILDNFMKSPAARGGLRPSDIITEVKRVQIQNADQVQNQVEATALGNTLLQF